MRHNQKNRICLVWVMAVISILTVLSVGVTYGRYRTDIYGDLTFENRKTEKVYLWGKKTEEGALLPLPGSWTVTDLSKTMPFTVTNGLPAAREETAPGGEITAETTQPVLSERDMTVSIQLAVNQGLTDAKALQVLLRMDEESIPAQAEPIREGTELHEKFGDGWIYRFLDDKGKPRCWELPGGQWSELSGELVIVDYTIDSEACIMQLQVIAEDNS